MSIECTDPAICEMLVQHQQQVVLSYLTHTVYVLTTIIVGLLGYDAYSKYKQERVE